MTVQATMRSPAALLSPAEEVVEASPFTLAEVLATPAPELSPSQEEQGAAEVKEVVKTGTLAQVRAALGGGVFAASLLEEDLVLLAVRRSPRVHTRDTLGIIRYLVEELNLSPDRPSGHLGRTPLFVAAAAGLESRARLLLELRADAGRVDSSEQTALFRAAACGNPKCLASLLAARADAGHVDKRGQTALFFAATAGARTASPGQCLQLLHAAEARSKDQGPHCDKQGQTALFYAATQEACVALLKLWGGGGAGAGAEEDCTKAPSAGVYHPDTVLDKFGQSPLFYAARNGRDACVEALLDARADCNLRDKVGGQSPLHWVASCCHAPTWKLLVARGARVVANDAGRFPFSLVGSKVSESDPDKQRRMSEMFDCVKAQATPLSRKRLASSLAAMAASPGIRGATRAAKRRRALAEAQAAGERALAAQKAVAPPMGQLVAVAAAPSGEEAPRREEGAPLRQLGQAVLEGDEGRIASLLRSADFDVNEQDAQGRTALFVAAHVGRPGAVRLLLEAGADPDLADLNGQTPLFHAAFRSPECVSLLLGAGADAGVVDAQGQTALFYAERSGRQEAVRLLSGHQAPSYELVQFNGAAPRSDAGEGIVTPVGAQALKAKARPLKARRGRPPSAGSSPAVTPTPTAAPAVSSRLSPLQSEASTSPASGGGAPPLPALAAWLRRHGLEPYAEALEASGYDDLSLIAALSKDDFEEMLTAAGVTKPGHRVKFRLAGQALLRHPGRRSSLVTP